jgi:DNA-binding NarL/FixJ family response regulator
MSVRVAVVTDDIKYRKGLVRSLRTAGGFDVCGSYSSAVDVIKDVRRARPGIVIVDLDLSDGLGVQCIRQVRQTFPSMNFVAISSQPEEDSVLRALHMGANGVVHKAHATDRIIDACNVVLDGGAYINEHTARKILDHVRTYPVIAAETHTLTPRELQVARCMDQGLSYAEIAEELYISIETVRRHCHNMYRKLDVRNKTEALSVLRDLKSPSPKRS